MKRNLLISLCTMLFALLIASSTSANTGLSINQQPLGPINEITVIDGRSMVSLFTIERIFGAETNVVERTITIVENDKVLTMTAASMAADLNGQSLTAPVAPQVIKGKLLVPLDFICTNLGAKVSWQPETQTIDVKYEELHNGMSAQEIMDRCTAATTTANTYKMRGTASVHLKTAAEDYPKNEENIQLKEIIQGSISQKPLLMDTKISIDFSSAPKALSGMPSQNMELFMNKTGMYLKMIDSEWVKMSLPDVNIESLIQQQDPTKQIEQMKESGIIMNLSNDAYRDGKDYFVIACSIGPEAYQKIIKNYLSMAINNDSSAISKLTSEAADNMKMDVFMKIYINKKTYLTKFSDGSFFLNMRAPMPSTEENPDKFMINMEVKLNYEYYDYKVSFEKPDVKNAITFEEYLAKHTTEASKQ